MSRYVINILASRDLDEIADRFAAKNLEAGEQFSAILTESVSNWWLSQVVGKAMLKSVQICEGCLWMAISCFTEF
jgi:hypothetical protein